MAQWDAATARKAITRAKSAKEASDDIYREAMEITFPNRENFTRSTEGTEKAQRNWDGASTVSVIKAANRLSSDFTPQFQPWGKIQLGPAARAMSDAAFEKALGKTKDDITAQLEATSKVVQAVFNGPGFPSASNELYLDWHYGQGGMQVMPNDDILGEPVIFTSMPISHFYAYQGPNGRLHRWFFWHSIAPSAIKAQWGDAKLPEDLEKLITDNNDKDVKLSSIVYRDYDEKEKPFRYEVFWTKNKDTHRIVARQSKTPPFVTPRHTLLAGENRGRGPILTAMPDIRTANKIVELTLRSAAISVGGVYTATDDGVKGKVNIKPFSVIKVRSNGGTQGPSLQRLEMPQNINFGELLLDKLHENIKKVIGDNSLPGEGDPIRSATEFVQRVRELIADQAGGLGRLYAEFIIPVWQRVIDILEQKQILQTDGMKVDQFLIEVVMTSPLAKGEAMGAVENLVRFMEILKSIGGPELMAFEVDMEKAPSEIGDLMDIPVNVRNTKTQKTALKKSFAAQQAQEAGGDPNVAAQAVEQGDAVVEQEAENAA